MAFPASLRAVRHARSTLIMASLATVRNRGMFERYERALAPEHKATVLEAVAATWMPLDAAAAHYAACDMLGLSIEQQVQSGRGTFDVARDTLLGTAVRMARSAGITPWHVFPMFQRFWDRGFDGGGVSVMRAGPKDAHVTVAHCSLVSSPYFRHGLRGLCAALTELFCTRAFVSEHRAAGPGSLAMRVQWA